MKIKLSVLAICILLLGGCSMEPAIKKSDDTGSSAQQVQSQENIEVGKKSEEKADGGIKLTVDASKDVEAGSLEQTISYYMFDGDKLISVKSENTYTDEAEAKKYAEQFAGMPESCVDVSQSGKKVTYYATKNALELMLDMKKEDVKKMGEEIGAVVEEF